ncbi:unnamed protein product [Rotaria socialis]|uniref:Uncharacterized protein n=1 Tax=Rotaria socialis TaxID=392032 RepID=A0A817UKL7_9BILA|nr:unnamed protein product [Rotaria socialis]
MKSYQSNPSPFLYANKWSQIFHNWISVLINLSHKQGTVYLNDVYDILPEYESKQLTDTLQNNWFDELKRSPQNPSLLRATIRTLGWEPMMIGLLFIPNKISTLIQLLLIVYIMEFFKPCSTMSIPFVCFLAILMSLTVMSFSFFHHRYYYLAEIFSIRMRIAYQGLIFRKVLRLSSRSLNTLSSGEITNLFSNDATQIQMILISFNYLWSTPLDIIVMVVLFWHFMNYISLIAIGYTILIVLIATLIGHIAVYYRTKILEVTDKRVKIMAEIIKSMRIVKMYCWESAFNREVRFVRKHEIVRYAIRFIFDSIQIIFTQTYITVSFLIIFGIMWLLSMHFDTGLFAVASCMLGYLEISLMEFGMGMHDLVHYAAAEKRIQKFLLLDEFEKDRRSKSTVSETVDYGLDNQMTSSSKVECHISQAYWETDGLFSLKNVIFHADPGDLICVIGPVGSGKSSLLQTLTNEITFLNGSIQLQDSFCYVPQEPWIFSSTIKENIIFGEEYNSKKFQRVIQAVALDTDFAQLPNGANTLVGDQGVMLSGGQKARVNMARALYRNTDIYLLDDPLSAVDVQVSKHLFERCIKDYLHEKICILVTHQIQFLQDATKIIVLNNGEMVHMGTYSELLESSSSFSNLLKKINQQEHKEHSKDTRIQSISRYVSVSESISEEKQLLLSDDLETKAKGSVNWRVYVEYLRAGAGLILGLILLISVFSMREAIFFFCNWWLAEWSEDKDYRRDQVRNCTEDSNKKMNEIRSMNSQEWAHHQRWRFYFYCGIACILVILTLLRTITLKVICLNASRVLHNKMFQRIIHCPISFFDLNPIGRILNRFTKDMAIVDEELPKTIFDFLPCFFQVIGIMILVSWLNPWAFIPSGIATMCMLYIRYRFAHCSRDLKRLEGITRSPFYSYLTSTIHGLKVIRSCHAENVCASEFFSHVDTNTRVEYLFLTTSRWAVIRFDWVTVFFVAIVTLLGIGLRVFGRQFSSADIALTLSYSLSLMGLLQWTIRQSVDIETKMTSVERILEYCSLGQETSVQRLPKYEPSINWPSHGRIVFDNVSISYFQDSPLVLRGISLNIEPGEKIGIIGRTGSGKSSFIQALFQMAILVDGHIQIDNVDIATVELYDVRNRISIIPQDPVLFHGTMRSNLDQFGHYSDAEIWNALEQVQLKSLVRNSMPNGLLSSVNESGSNLSVGQKQLVCLARAILKKSKILVIDEATANVDNATDELIQRAICDQFKACTVLTIAHRLRTVIDSDRIMVLSNGELVEFDTPETLLSDVQSHFAILVEQTGTNEADYLRTIANLKLSMNKSKEQ